MRKLELKKIIDAIKPVKDMKKPVAKAETPSGPKVRDMRDMAKELGSYGADDYFGGDVA